MDIDGLNEFIANENARLREQYGITDEKMMVLLQTVKLSEELGELCDETLAAYSLQRDEKLRRYGESELEQELADVLITSLLLADSMNVDVTDALAEKIDRIERRYE